MTIPRPQEWTKAEVHQLRMLAKRKVSADSIAKLLGRYVGSVRTKALELRLILSRKVKAIAATISLLLIAGLIAVLAFALLSMQ